LESTAVVERSCAVPKKKDGAAGEGARDRTFCLVLATEGHSSDTQLEEEGVKGAFIGGGLVGGEVPIKKTGRRSL